MRKSQIGNHVTYSRLSEEIGIGAHTKRQAGGAQAERECTGLRIRTEEDTHLAGVFDVTALEKPLDLGSHEMCLV